MKRIWLSMSGAMVVLIAIVACVALYLVPDRASEIWMEIAKACIQLVVVVGLGGVAGLVLRSVDELRNQRRARNDRRFAIFQQLVDAYHRLKFVRRQLRTVGLRHPGPTRLRPEQLTALRKGMTSIIEVDLTLEQIDRELDAQSVFSRAEDVRKELEGLRRYVSGLVKEWEKHGGKLWEDQQTIHVADLPRLQAFLGPADHDFRLNAATPMGWVQWIVRDELLGSWSSRRSKGPRNVPDVARQTVELAQMDLVMHGFKPDKITEVDVDSTMKPAGTVVGTDPPAGQSVPSDSVIELRVSRANQFTMPDLYRQFRVEAEANLHALGWTGVLVGEPDAEGGGEDGNPVISQSPSPGQSVKFDATITLAFGG